MNEAGRTYDIVVFGATGFTGKLVAEYLHNKQDETFRWAIAGRNAAKLERVKAELGLDVDILVGDSAEYDTLTAITAQTKVILTTVGPYIKYGEPLVKACVETSTDYVDITGEPDFVNKMYATYDDEAAAKKLRIISCCGFDSIPHDLGAYIAVKALDTTEPIKLEGFVSASGTFSGGTWQSAVEAMGNVRNASEHSGKRPVSDGRTVRGVAAKPHNEKAVNGWVVPMPTVDPQIVLNSASVLPVYGNNFSYGHYIRVGSLPALAAMGSGIGAVTLLAQFGPTKRMLLNYKKSGDGPSPEKRAQSSFRVTFVGEGGGKRVVAEASGGDPGYTETSKMVSEAALCLVLDSAELPQHYGYTTTAIAMGDALLERLRKAGLVFKIVSLE